ncbi:DUF1636 family protein [Maritalea mediterranea]|uniref:DUF1636 domain-containing protein n=1 Tax=Maritalea mediterranea TaxID=2909667 RepID=A0ABS9E6N7_9HYPH|nr:DUF1636 domain-containing protein [Maritalea mediterranea]MCF4097440.1 DUF1636 domain-containing protein [Maritalea mediterranea]
MAPRLIICSTCKFSPTSAFNEKGETGGELLADLVEAECDRQGMSLDIVRHPCLWSCKQSCAIQLQDDERTGYHAGGFTPDQPTAAAIIDWVFAHQRTTDGDVPFAEWPQAMLGHFIARLPTIKKEKEDD